MDADDILDYVDHLRKERKERGECPECGEVPSAHKHTCSLRTDQDPESSRT